MLDISVFVFDVVGLVIDIAGIVVDATDIVLDVSRLLVVVDAPGISTETSVCIAGLLGRVTISLESALVIPGVGTFVTVWRASARNQLKIHFS